MLHGERGAVAHVVELEHGGCGRVAFGPGDGADRAFHTGVIGVAGHGADEGCGFLGVSKLEGAGVDVAELLEGAVGLLEVVLHGERGAVAHVVELEHGAGGLVALDPGDGADGAFHIGVIGVAGHGADKGVGRLGIAKLKGTGVNLIVACEGAVRLLEVVLYGEIRDVALIIELEHGIRGGVALGPGDILELRVGDGAVKGEAGDGLHIAGSAVAGVEDEFLIGQGKVGILHKLAVFILKVVVYLKGRPLEGEVKLQLVAGGFGHVAGPGDGLEALRLGGGGVVLVAGGEGDAALIIGGVVGGAEDKFLFSQAQGLILCELTGFAGGFKEELDGEVLGVSHIVELEGGAGGGSVSVKADFADAVFIFGVIEQPVLLADEFFRGVLIAVLEASALVVIDDGIGGGGAVDVLIVMLDGELGGVALVVELELGSGRRVALGPGNGGDVAFIFGVIGEAGESLPVSGGFVLFTEEEGIAGQSFFGILRKAAVGLLKVVADVKVRSLEGVIELEGGSGGSGHVVHPLNLADAVCVVRVIVVAFAGDHIGIGEEGLSILEAEVLLVSLGFQGESAAQLLEVMLDVVGGLLTLVVELEHGSGGCVALGPADGGNRSLGRRIGEAGLLHVEVFVGHGVSELEASSLTVIGDGFGGIGAVQVLVVVLHGVFRGVALVIELEHGAVGLGHLSGEGDGLEAVSQLLVGIVGVAHGHACTLEVIIGGVQGVAKLDGFPGGVVGVIVVAAIIICKVVLHPDAVLGHLVIVGDDGIFGEGEFAVLFRDGHAAVLGGDGVAFHLIEHAVMEHNRAGLALTVDHGIQEVGVCIFGDRLGRIVVDDFKGDLVVSVVEVEDAFGVGLEAVKRIQSFIRGSFGQEVVVGIVVYICVGADSGADGEGEAFRLGRAVLGTALEMMDHLEGGIVSGVVEFEGEIGEGVVIAVVSDGGDGAIHAGVIGEALGHNVGTNLGGSEDRLFKGDAAAVSGDRIFHKRIGAVDILGVMLDLVLLLVADIVELEGEILAIKGDSGHSAGHAGCIGVAFQQSLGHKVIIPGVFCLAIFDDKAAGGGFHLAGLSGESAVRILEVVLHGVALLELGIVELEHSSVGSVSGGPGDGLVACGVDIVRIVLIALHIGLDKGIRVVGGTKNEFYIALDRIRLRIEAALSILIVVLHLESGAVELVVETQLCAGGGFSFPFNPAVAQRIGIGRIIGIAFGDARQLMFGSAVLGAEDKVQGLVGIRAELLVAPRVLHILEVVLDGVLLHVSYIIEVDGKVVDALIHAAVGDGVGTGVIIGEAGVFALGMLGCGVGLLKSEVHTIGIPKLPPLEVFRLIVMKHSGGLFGKDIVDGDGGGLFEVERAVRHGDDAVFRGNLNALHGVNLIVVIKHGVGDLVNDDFGPQIFLPGRAFHQSGFILVIVVDLYGNLFVLIVQHQLAIPVGQELMIPAKADILGFAGHPSVIGIVARSGVLDKFVGIDHRSHLEGGVGSFFKAVRIIQRAASENVHHFKTRVVPGVVEFEGKVLLGGIALFIIDDGAGISVAVGEAVVQNVLAHLICGQDGLTVVDLSGVGRHLFKAGTVHILDVVLDSEFFLVDRIGKPGDTVGQFLGNVHTLGFAVRQCVTGHVGRFQAFHPVVPLVVAVLWIDDVFGTIDNSSFRRAVDDISFRVDGITRLIDQVAAHGVGAVAALDLGNLKVQPAQTTFAGLLIDKGGGAVCVVPLPFHKALGFHVERYLVFEGGRLARLQLAGIPVEGLGLRVVGHRTLVGPVAAVRKIGVQRQAGVYHIHHGAHGIGHGGVLHALLDALANALEDLTEIVAVRVVIERLAVLSGRGEFLQNLRGATRHAEADGIVGVAGGLSLILGEISGVRIGERHIIVMAFPSIAPLRGNCPAKRQAAAAANRGRVVVTRNPEILFSRPSGVPTAAKHTSITMHCEVLRSLNNGGVGIGGLTVAEQDDELVGRGALGEHLIGQVQAALRVGAAVGADSVDAVLERLIGFFIFFPPPIAFFRRFIGGQLADHRGA